MRKNFCTRQILVLLAATLLYMSSIYTINPISAGFCASLGGSGFWMGIVAGASNLTALFCRPAVGNAIDHRDRRTVGLAGLGAMGAGSLICAGAANVGVLMLGRICIGAGYATSSGALSTWVASSLAPEHIGQGMSIYGMMAATAQAVAPAVGLKLAGVAGYRAACAFGGLLVLLGCLLILTLEPSRRARPAGGEAPRRTRLFLPRLLPVTAVVFLFCVPYNGTNSFLATVASERGLEFSIGSFFTIYAVFLLGMRFVLSRVLDRLSFWRSAALSVPFGVLSMLCLHRMRSLPVMILAAFLLTFAFGMMQPVCQATCVKSVPEEEYGVANSMYYIGLDLGGACGPALSGVIYQIFGSERLFLALALVPALSLVVLALSKRALPGGRQGGGENQGADSLI